MKVIGTAEATAVIADYFDLICDTDYAFDESEILRRMNANAVDAEPQWIPVSEKLPEAPFGCLVTVEDEEPMTGALFPNLLPYFVGWDGEQWNDADGEQCPFEVLAWMPLPKPYEVENDEIH